MDSHAHGVRNCLVAQPRTHKNKHRIIINLINMPVRVKNRTANKKSKPVTKPPMARPQKSPALAGLDKAAIGWLKLLADPCGAELTEPCYGSTGTGYLTRSRTLFPIPNGALATDKATDAVFEISPCYGASAFVRWGWSSILNGSLGNASVFGADGLITSSVVGRSRCVALCARVIYTGTELDRKGYVGMVLDSGISLSTGEPIAGTANSWSQACPNIHRLGDADVELRWVPAAEDSQFLAAGEEWSASNISGNSLQIALVGITPGAATLEITSVWEWQPSEEGSYGNVVGMRAPASSVPFNTVLRALGDLGKFAYHRMGGRDAIMGGLRAAKGTFPGLANTAMALML